jgi:hypothetical protein
MYLIFPDALGLSCSALVLISSPLLLPDRTEHDPGRRDQISERLQTLTVMLSDPKLSRLIRSERNGCLHGTGTSTRSPRNNVASTRIIFTL